MLLLTALDQELTKTFDVNKKYVESRLPEITEKIIKECKDFCNLELIQERRVEAKRKEALREDLKDEIK